MCFWEFIETKLIIPYNEHSQLQQPESTCHFYVCCEIDCWSTTVQQLKVLLPILHLPKTKVWNFAQTLFVRANLDGIQSETYGNSARGGKRLGKVGTCQVQQTFQGLSAPAQFWPLPSNTWHLCQYIQLTFLQMKMIKMWGIRQRKWTLLHTLSAIKYEH